MTTSSELKTILLPTGRRVSYAEYGSLEGVPLFYLHGFPSSRLESWTIAKLAEQRGVRLVCPDRPGFGLSTLRPESGTEMCGYHLELPRIIDYPSTILSLADHLSISQFSVVGCTGGGPFALACAALLPSDRILSVGLVAPGGPWIDLKHTPPLGSSIPDSQIIKAEDLQRNVPWASYLLSSAVYRAPTITTWGLNGVIGCLRWLVQRKAIQRRMEAWIENQQLKAQAAGDPKPEESELPAKVRENVLGTVLEAFRQGSEGAVHEAKLLSSDWGIDFAAIRADLAVKIWHGKKDVNVPINQIRYLAQRIPGAGLKEYDVNHFGIGAHIEEISAELTAPPK